MFKELLMCYLMFALSMILLFVFSLIHGSTTLTIVSSVLMFIISGITLFCYIKQKKENKK